MRISGRRGGLAATAFIGVAIVGAIGAAFLLDAVLPDSGRAGNIFSVIQSFVTAVAIATAGIWAYFRFQVFRTFEPHLTIEHRVFHRRLSENYTHIDVTVVMYNSSRVQVEIRESFALVQEVAPISDDEAGTRRDEAWVEEEDPTFLWPIVGRLARKWDENELIVEPGERHSETFEFIIDKAGVYIDPDRPLRTVLIYTYFKNEGRRSNQKSARGWAATTVYDIDEEPQ